MFFDYRGAIMKRFLLTAAFVLGLCATAMSQTRATRPEVSSFDLTPVPPPTPALKYELLFDDTLDCRPGNAAMLYLDSILLLGPDGAAKAQKAEDAYEAKDMASFDSLADSLDHRALLGELDLAGRCEDCNWGAPLREMGYGTLLPHLNPLRDLARMLEVRALRQIEQGKVDDALATLRLGYELSDKVGREPVVISGLVSVGIAALMDQCLEQLMNRPDAPNLYWALSEFPGKKPVMRRASDIERMLWPTSVGASLAKANAGEDLSDDEWRAVFDYTEGAVQSFGSSTTGHARLPDPVKDTSPELMRQAREQYALSHQMTPEQAGEIDPIIVIGRFYFQQYRIAGDDMFKLQGLAYPVLLVKSAECDLRVARLLHEQPANPFLQMLPSLHRAGRTFARIDRQLAALTAVEAIRSYAAANGGELPSQLADITDTPVPLNPATGKPFEYRVNNGTATLSDSWSEGSLSFTIKIRK
jgi:hypothetical protein